MKKNILLGKTPAYSSYPDDGKKHPGLIIIHEIWGLTDHIKKVADRFAAEGYSVLAPDLFHGTSFEGKINQSLLDKMHHPETRDEAQKQMRELMAPIRAPEFAQDVIANLKQCVDYLLTDENANGKIGVIGFCFGGSYAFHLAANDKRITTAVPFYGQAPTLEEIQHIDCPILAFYGDQDENLMKSLPQLKDDMNKQGKVFESVIYPNAGHAFFNDSNEKMYKPEAAQEAWKKTLAYLRLIMF